MAASYQRRNRDEQEMRRRLEEEFSRLTVSEAYHKCLTILRNGQEESWKRGLPNLETIRVKNLNLSGLPSLVRIMDFGGGTGTAMSAICETLQALNKDVVVSAAEPHEESLEKYKKCIENVENATLDVAYTGGFQDYIGKSEEDLKSIGAYPEELQDRVLAIHTMYHVSNWLDDSVDPYEDIKQAVFAMYTILKPGGMLVIEFEGGENDFIWNNCLRSFEILLPKEVMNLKKVQEARCSLLYQGKLADILNESFPTFTASIEHMEASCGYVLPSLAEVGAFVFLMYFDGCAGDTSKFDPRMLSSCIDFVQREGRKYGLSQEEDGMWRLSNVTHFITIKKV